MKKKYMHQNEMAGVINQHFKLINKLTKKAVHHFHREVIYNIRTEIKALRAFIKLIRTEPGKTDHLKFSRRLKTFHGYIGIIRNIQLQEHFMAELLPRDAADISEYTHQLKAEAEGWKKEVIKLTLDHMDFNEEREILLAALPSMLSKTSVSKFLRRKVEDIDSLLILRKAGESNLHALRGVLKDILYNWPYVQAEVGRLLPFEMNGYDKLRTLTNILGQYGDQCTALDFLQPAHIESVKNEKGQELLRLARVQLEKQRDKLRQDFFSCLLGLRENFPVT